MNNDLRQRDEMWLKACGEIIDRCVAPGMYALARSMLDRAFIEARRELRRRPPA